MKKQQKKRNVLVMAGMLGSLTLTSVVLLALAPNPLAPPARSLFAVDSTDTLDAVFTTETAIAAGRWKAIYIHHSMSASGDAGSFGENTGVMGDHFLIGNGEGAGDGEIQVSQRWNAQQAANPPGKVGDDCITICVVGDFDRKPPTARQLKRLGDLVSAMQRQLGVSRQNVIAINRPGSSAGIGSKFPTRALAERLAP